MKQLRSSRGGAGHGVIQVSLSKYGEMSDQAIQVLKLLHDEGYAKLVLDRVKAWFLQPAGVQP